MLSSFELIGMIPFRTEIIQGVVVNVSGIKWSFVGAIVTAIIVVGKCTTCLLNRNLVKLPVQVVLYEHPQVIIGTEPLLIRDTRSPNCSRKSSLIRSFTMHQRRYIAR